MECNTKSCGDNANGATEHFGKINTEGLQALIKSKTTMVLIDARGPKFDDGKRIGPAISLNSEATEQQIQKAIPSKEALVVIYCSSLRCPASHRVANLLTGLGYKNIVKYEEGLEGWMNAGHKVHESSTASKAQH